MDWELQGLWGVRSTKFQAEHHQLCVFVMSVTTKSKAQYKQKKSLGWENVMNSVFAQKYYYFHLMLISTFSVNIE